MIKKFKILIITGVLIPILFVTGCQDAPPPEAQFVDADFFNMDMPVSLSKGAKVMAFGKVVSPRQRNILIGVSSTLNRFNFTQGDLIKRGDVIADLDISSHRYQIQVAEQNLKKARLQLLQYEQEYEKSGKQIDQEYRSLSITLETATKELVHLKNEYNRKKALFSDKNDPAYLKLVSEGHRAKEALVLAEENHKKNQTLYKNDAISEQSLTQSAGQVEEAQNRVYNNELGIESYNASMRSELEQLELRITSKEGSVKNNETRLKNMSSPEITAIEIQKTQIQLQEQELQQMKDKLETSYLQKGDLVADFDRGILSQSYAVDGDILTPGQKVCTILDADSLRVEAQIPEEFIKDVAIGDTAIITPTSDQGRIYTGVVSKIAAMADYKNGETVVTIFVDIQDNDGFLLPNFNVDVQILGPEGLQNLEEGGIDSFKNGGQFEVYGEGQLPEGAVIIKEVNGNG